MVDTESVERAILEKLDGRSLLDVAIEQGVFFSVDTLKQIGEQRRHFRDQKKIAGVLVRLGLVDSAVFEDSEVLSEGLETNDPLPTLTARYDLQYKIPSEVLEIFDLKRTGNHLIVNKTSLEKAEGWAKGMLRHSEGYLYSADRTRLRMFLGGHFRREWLSDDGLRTTFIHLIRDPKEFRDAGVPPIFGAKYEVKGAKATLEGGLPFNYPFSDTILSFFGEIYDTLVRHSSSREPAPDDPNRSPFDGKLKHLSVGRKKASLANIKVFRARAYGVDGKIDSGVRAEYRWFFEKATFTGVDPFKPTEKSLEKLEAIVEDLADYPSEEIEPISYANLNDPKKRDAISAYSIVSLPFWWRFFTEQDQEEILVDYARTLPRDVEDKRNVARRISREKRDTYEKVVNVFPHISFLVDCWSVRDLVVGCSEDELVQSVVNEEGYDSLSFREQGKKVICALESRFIRNLPSNIRDISIDSRFPTKGLSLAFLRRSGVDEKTFRRLLGHIAQDYSLEIVLTASDEDLLEFAKNNPYGSMLGGASKLAFDSSRFHDAEAKFWHGVVTRVVDYVKKEVRGYPQMSGAMIAEELGICKSYSNVLKRVLTN